jgi:hypothetical protein
MRSSRNILAAKVSRRTDFICWQGLSLLVEGDNHVKQLVQHLVKQPMQRQEVSHVTWSTKGIRVVYKNAMVVLLSAEDMYPLAIPPKVVSIVASERAI